MSVDDMGVATGGQMAGVRNVSPGSEFQGDVPPEFTIVKENVLSIYQKVSIFQYF